MVYGSEDAALAETRAYQINQGAVECFARRCRKWAMETGNLWLHKKQTRKDGGKYRNPKVMPCTKGDRRVVELGNYSYKKYCKRNQQDNDFKLQLHKNNSTLDYSYWQFVNQKIFIEKIGDVMCAPAQNMFL